jgi:hypothetical protein
MSLTLSTLPLGFVLALIQFVAAVPWLLLAFLSPDDREALRRRPFAPWVLRAAGIALAVCVVVPLIFSSFVTATDSLEALGRGYAALLQVQLTVDLFILGFALVLWLWPKGGAVALAAFREGVRQWLFWLIAIGAAFFMFVSVFLPYFTFGEDYLMVKQLGYDAILLAAVVFGALTAALSIGDEIEGRTAITVISKPVSRRQFMLGKYVGIILAALFMFGLLAACFEGILLLKHWWDKLEPFNQTKESLTATQQTWIGVVPMPGWVTEWSNKMTSSEQMRALLRGIGHWMAHTGDTLPALVLCFSQVMVLVALAVALATRVPMAVNLLAVLAVYFLAHLTPVLLAISRMSRVPKLVGFVAEVLDTVVPDLGMFKVDPAVISDSPPPAFPFTQYVGSVTLYGLIYTAIVLLFGLILFEDRDLA